MTEKICSLSICRCANFHRANFELHFQSPSLLEVKTFSLQKYSFVWIVLLFYYEPTKIALSYVKIKNSYFIKRIRKIFLILFFFNCNRMTQISRFLGSQNDKAEQNCNTIVCNLLSITKIYFSELLPMNKIFAVI